MGKIGPARAALTAVVAVALGVLLAYAATSGNVAPALVSSALLILVASLANRALMAKAARRGEVLFDEMHVRIRDRAAWQAYRALMAVAALAVGVIWLPTLFFSNYVVPYEVVVLSSGLVLGVGILTVAHLAFYAYYTRSRKAVE